MGLGAKRVLTVMLMDAFVWKRRIIYGVLHQNTGNKSRLAADISYKTETSALNGALPILYNDKSLNKLPDFIDRHRLGQQCLHA